MKLLGEGKGVVIASGCLIGYNGRSARVSVSDGVRFIGGVIFEPAIKSILISLSVKYVNDVSLLKTNWYKKYPYDFVIVGDNIMLKYTGDEKDIDIPTGVKRIGRIAFSETCKADASKETVDFDVAEWKLSLRRQGVTRRYNSLKIPASVCEIDPLAFMDSELNEYRSNM